MPEHDRESFSMEDGDHAEVKPRPIRISDKKVRILHNRVGTYERGQVVALSEFDEPQPLLDLGAIAYVDDDAVDEPVRPSLYDAIHSQSPPTLPNASYTDATQHEINVASGLARAAKNSDVGPGGVTYVGPGSENPASA